MPRTGVPRAVVEGHARDHNQHVVRGRREEATAKPRQAKSGSNAATEAEADGDRAASARTSVASPAETKSTRAKPAPKQAASAPGNDSRSSVTKKRQKPGRKPDRRHHDEETLHAIHDMLDAWREILAYWDRTIRGEAMAATAARLSSPVAHDRVEAIHVEAARTRRAILTKLEHLLRPSKAKLDRVRQVVRNAREKEIHSELVGHLKDIHFVQHRIEPRKRAAEASGEATAEDVVLNGLPPAALKEYNAMLTFVRGEDPEDPIATAYRQMAITVLNARWAHELNAGPKTVHHVEHMARRRSGQLDEARQLAAELPNVIDELRTAGSPDRSGHTWLAAGIMQRYGLTSSQRTLYDRLTKKK